MPASFNLPLPLKGVNRFCSRSEQPPDTCWDALNILPFDRYGRRRIAQRAGSGRLYEDILGLTVEAGSTTTTVVDVGLADAGYTEDEIFGTVHFTSGALLGQSALILSYDRESDTITLAQTLASAPSATDGFEIRRTLGPSSQTIRLLKQVSTAPTSGSVTADALVFGEDFSAYPNGTKLRDIGGVTDARWRMLTIPASSVMDSSAPVKWLPSWSTNTTIINSHTVTSGTLYSLGSTNFDANVWSIRTNPSVGSNYRVDVAFGHPTTVQASRGFAVGTRLLADPSADDLGVFVVVIPDSSFTNHVRLVTLSSTEVSVEVASFDYPTDVLATGTHTLSVSVAGNLYSIYMDGDFLFSATVTDHAANTGLALVTTTHSGGLTPRINSYLVYTGDATQVTATNSLIAVSGRTIHAGQLRTGLPITIGGLDILTGPSRPEAAILDRYCYFVDGADEIVKLDVITNSIQTYTATAGTAPTKMTLAAMWRGRLVLAAGLDDPQNFFFARVGTPTDWDYAQTDPGAAFAGNVGTIGRIGEPITALIPFSDDVLIIGTTRSIYAINGDPADGGTIDLVTSTVGIAGARSWAVDDTGVIWFVGQGGLYRLQPTPGSDPENVSRSVYPQFFQVVNTSANFFDLQWDNDRHGLWVFATSVATGASTHLFIDGRSGGFWPTQWPNDHGPMSSLAFYGDDPDDRVLLLGGRNGRVYAQSNRTLRDEVSTPISCQLFVGPMMLNPKGDCIITGLDIDMGEVASGDNPAVWNMNVTVRGAKTAYTATEGTDAIEYVASYSDAGRGQTRVNRCRGGWHALRFSNSADGDYFSIEKATIGWIPAGTQR